MIFKQLIARFESTNSTVKKNYNTTTISDPVLLSIFL